MSLTAAPIGQSSVEIELAESGLTHTPVARPDPRLRLDRGLRLIGLRVSFTRALIKFKCLPFIKFKNIHQRVEPNETCLLR